MASLLFVSKFYMTIPFGTRDITLNVVENLWGHITLNVVENLWGHLIWATSFMLASTNTTVFAAFLMLLALMACRTQLLEWANEPFAVGMMSCLLTTQLL